jgi:hypothetical protein
MRCAGRDLSCCVPVCEADTQGFGQGILNWESLLRIDGLIYCVLRMILILYRPSLYMYRLSVASTLVLLETLMVEGLTSAEVVGYLGFIGRGAAANGQPTNAARLTALELMG